MVIIMKKSAPKEQKPKFICIFSSDIKPDKRCNIFFYIQTVPVNPVEENTNFTSLRPNYLTNSLHSEML